MAQFFRHIITKASYLTIILLIMQQAVMAQVKYPVTSNIQVLSPNPVYLSDYHQVASNNLSVNMVLNDLNEPQWDVRLKFTITGQDLKVETRVEQLPSEITTLLPGQLWTLSGDQLYDYLAPNRIRVSGSGAALFNQTGRFPEGLYNFCVEALDYNSGIPVSLPSCQGVWIQLKEPPLVIAPVKDGYIKPMDPQLIQFQWQPITFSATEDANIVYQLNIFELTDYVVNPDMALQNGKALQIFESEPIFGSVYNYSISDPILEAGKRYIYTIRAIDENGRDLIKNNGYSEIMNFYYGYPTGGVNELIAPENGYVHQYNEEPSFTWSATNKSLPFQPFEYKVQVTKILEDQDSIRAFDENPLWYEGTVLSSTTNNKSVRLNKPLEALEKFAWRVLTYSDEQLVAESEIRTFTGPPLMDYFIAAGYHVKVLKTHNGDISSLDGRCRLIFNKDTLEADFNGIELESSFAEYFLKSGEIVFDELEIESIPVPSVNSKMEQAYFSGEKVRLNREGFKILGNVKVPFPHPTTDSKAPMLVSKNEWIRYDDLKLTGMLFLSESNDFDLIDPLGFSFHFDTTSVIEIYEGEYKARMYGSIDLPEKDNLSSSEDFSLSFGRAKHLNYFEGADTIQQKISIPLVKNTKLNALSTQLVFDLSEDRTPGHFRENPGWKGLYLTQYSVTIHGEADEKGYWSPDYSITLTNSEPDTSFYTVLTSTGLNSRINYEPDTSLAASIYTFNGKMTELQLTVEDRAVKNSFIRGEIVVPFLSEKSSFGYKLPIRNYGFDAGYVYGIKDLQYTFNPSSEDQQVGVKIIRAEFAQNDRITMAMNLDFPVLNASLKGVSGITIWGNSEIGMNSPNGSIMLNEQVNGKVSTYPVILQALVMGRQKDHYIIGTQMQINMSEDIAGTEGAPTTSFYSASKNALLNEDYDAGDQVGDVGMWNPVLGNFTQDDLENMSDEQIGDIIAYELEKAFNKSPEEKKKMISGLLRSLSIDGSPISNETSSMASEFGDSLTINEFVRRSGLLEGLSQKEVELVEAIVEGFVDELSKPLQIEIEKNLTRIGVKADSVITKGYSEAIKVVDEKLVAMVESIVMDAARSFPIEEVANLLEYAVANTLIVVKQEAYAAIEKSIRENINEPLLYDFSIYLPKKLNDTIVSTMSNLVISGLEGKVDNQYMKEQVANNMGKTLEESADYMYRRYVHPDSLKQRIAKIGDDFIYHYNWDVIGTKIVEFFTENTSIGDLFEIAGVDGAIEEGISKMLGGGEFGNSIASTALSVAGGLKFKDGKLKLEAVPIVVVTPWVKLTGTAAFKRDDPLFGDCFASVLDILILKPKEIPFKGVYKSGRTTDGLDYWVAELKTNGDNAEDSTKTGGDISEEIQTFESPVRMGAAALVGGSMRVYKHMIDTTGIQIIPSSLVEYGGYFHFVLMDGNANGLFRMELGGGVIQYADDQGLVLDMAGDMALLASGSSAESDGGSAMTRAGIKIHYNSLEDHFLGLAWLEITDGVCMSASTEVETKPGYWHVHVGDEYNMVKVTPLCAGWGGAGYLLLDNRAVEVALGVSYSYRFNKGKNVGIGYLGINVEAYAALGVVAGLQYKPNLKLLKAGIWAELYGRVDVEYDVKVWPLKFKGSVSLFEIYLRANLMLYFEPTPSTLSGEASGYISILNGLVNTNFSANMEMTL